MRKAAVDLVITDLDNTLYDWFELWYHPFMTLLDALQLDSGISREVLVREIKQFHERHQTSEDAFLVQELPSLQKRHPGEDVTKVYDDANHDYRRISKDDPHLVHRGMHSPA